MQDRHIFHDPNLLGGMADHDSLNTISLYPNPSQNAITIKSSKVILSVELYGINGALLSETLNINADEYALNIASITNGMYFMNVVFEDGSTSIEKVVFIF